MHCTLISFVSIFSKTSQNFLKMIILSGELMRFVIYVDNVQQYIYTLYKEIGKPACVGPNLIILQFLKNI